MFSSKRDLKVYQISRTNGRTLAKGKVVDAFKVETIQLFPGPKKYLWGIDESASIDGDSIPFRLFKAAPQGTFGPINSLYTSFKIQK